MQKQMPSKKSLVLAGASLQLIAMASKKGSDMLKERSEEALAAANQSQITKPVAV